MKIAEAACGKTVERQVMPILEQRAQQVLGSHESAWFEYLTDAHTHSPVVLFHYPSLQPDGFAYLRRSVKLEFGSLTDQQPTGRHRIAPWIAETMPQAFTDWQCEVVALEVERSFWEKATILHTEYHRPESKSIPDRFSRHYADTAALAVHPVVKHAVDRHELRERVVSWKSRFFGSGWASFETAQPGSFRLVPPNRRLPDLRQDYQAMRDMYLAEPVAFDAILETLRDLESRINAR
jgi:hypothetical protein